MLFAFSCAMLGLALAAEAPVPAGDVAGLAAQLTRAELCVRDPARSAAEASACGHEQQAVYRVLATRPDLAVQVLVSVPEDLRTIAETNTAATRSIMGTVGKKRTSLPAWSIVQPAPPDELLADYEAAAAEFGVPWEILAAIHLVETRMGRLRGVSGAGARGPMQFIPETWARYGKGDIEDNRDAIFAAARYLVAMGAPGDLDKALWHYNPTDRYVNAVRGYARVMEADPLAFRGYYGWEVYYSTVRGAVWLPVGYAQDVVVPVTVWCAEHACPEE